MKKKLIGVFLLMSLVCGSISAQGLPDRKETLETLIKVNNYFMKKYADYRTPSYNGIIRPSNIWTRGVYYEGLMALHSVFLGKSIMITLISGPIIINGECVTGILPAMRTTSAADRFISNCIISVLPRR